MKTSNNKQRLKTYKIKNHDSGKTYSVKAVNYTDAKTKYNKHILKDNRHTFEALWYSDPDYDKMMTQTFATEKEAMDFYRKNKGKPTFHGWWVTERYPGSWAVKKELVMDTIAEDAPLLVERIGDYTIKNSNDGSHLKFEVFYKRKKFAIAASVDAAKKAIEKHKSKAQFKDALPLVEKIGDYTINKNDDDFLKFAVFYKGQIIAETTTISVAKKEINSHKKEVTKDSLTEDAYVYPTNASTTMASSFAKQCVEKFGGKVAAKNGNKYVYVAPDKDTAEKAKTFLETKYSSMLPSVKFIVGDSLTEDEQLKYQTTFRGEESQEIRLSEGSCYCNYDKTRNTTHVIFMGGRRNQVSRDFTIRGKITTVEQLKKEIDKHLKYLSSKGWLTEDADKSMGTYNGYSIKQNVDGNIYVLKKSGEKEFFESWKKAHEAIKTGVIKDSHSLQTYKIKNTDSGKTYRVKATSYQDAKDKYEKFIAKNPVNDAVQWDTLLANLGFMHHGGHGKIQKWKYRGDNYNDFEKAINHIRRIDRTLILSSSHINSNEYIITIEKPITDSFSEDALSKFVQSYLGTKRVSSKAEQDEIIKFLLERNKITTEDIPKVRSLLKIIKDSITEDAFDYDTMYKINAYLDRNEDRIERMSAKQIFNFVKKQFPNISNTKIAESLEYVYQGSRLNFAQFKDSLTEDADIAQTDIKSTYLPEDANADNIQYLGFNEKRKLSFYGYGDRYFVHYDLEGRTEEVDKETVQKILKKNILGEIDENDLINKEPQSEEIVSDNFDWKKKQERGDK